MKSEEILAILQALAVGDSFGKTTEFASRTQITQAFASINTLLTPEQALAHADMPYGSVTDDTEQNLFLLEEYARTGVITPQTAAAGILRWYTESPEPQKYIGPSSARAIRALQEGIPVEEAGRNGTSCGGVMRTPAAFLCSTSLEQLADAVCATLLPTHNTFQATEAALAYAYALWGARQTKDAKEILHWALQGCEEAAKRYPDQAMTLCAPTCAKRLPYLFSVFDTFETSSQLLDFLFSIYGTTISSCDVCTAAFGLFLWARSNVFEAVRLAAMVGGDTDTIGCLAAVLCTVYAGGHNIPASLVKDVCEPLDLPRAVQWVERIRKEESL